MADNLMIDQGQKNDLGNQDQKKVPGNRGQKVTSGNRGQKVTSGNGDQKAAQEYSNSLGQNQIQGFITSQVVGRGLDERTAMAYRLDLELFYLWVEEQGKMHADKSSCQMHAVQVDWMDDYLEYLIFEKGRRFSTVSRKHQVFRCFLDYLKAEGVVEEYRKLKPVTRQEEITEDTQLTKAEVDAFFQAIQKEYDELDSDFRKRVCLRDQIMMELLFYHRIEVSELLRLEVSDYHWKTAVLKIRRKRQKDRAVYLFSQKLQEQMRQWLSEHAYFEHDGVYSNRMFLSKLGKPISMKMVINIFDKYRVMAGIEKDCTPKDLKNGLGRYAEELVWEQG